VTGIHGKYDKKSLGFGGFIQLGHNQIKAEAAFGVSVAAFNGVRWQESLYIWR